LLLKRQKKKKNKRTKKKGAAVIDSAIIRASTVSYGRLTDTSRTPVNVHGTRISRALARRLLSRVPSYKMQFYRSFYFSRFYAVITMIKRSTAESISYVLRCYRAATTCVYGTRHQKRCSTTRMTFSGRQNRLPNATTRKRIKKK
jgi:hypothetical protein